MRVGDKVQLKQTMQLIPAGASTPRGADMTTFDKGSQFDLIGISGEKATVKDSDGNFWTVLLEFIGLVTEATTLNGNTTINQGVSFGKKVVNFFKSVVSLFKRKK
jgi:hypothetical protein